MNIIFCFEVKKDLNSVNNSSLRVFLSKYIHIVPQKLNLTLIIFNPALTSFDPVLASLAQF